MRRPIESVGRRNGGRSLLDGVRLPAEGEMIARLLGAVQFLTIVPIQRRTTEPWRAAIFFPTVGAAIGAAGGGLMLATRDRLPMELSALLVVGFWIAVTGALHEDGLADVADGCRAERSRERILEIMKDSRVGTFGAVAVVLSVVVRWQGVTNLAISTMPALVASQTLSRAASVVLARISKPATDGMGGELTAKLSTPVAIVAALQGVAAAIWCGPRAAVAMLAGCAVIVILARLYFHRRIGGVTGDCLGATSQVVEMFVLVLLACQSCMW